MTATTLTAETYGLTCASPGKTTGAQATQEQLETLLSDPCREQKLTAFEAAHQLPKLTPTPQAPHPREARYIAMTRQTDSMLPEAARNTPSSLWHLLAGLSS